MWIEVSHGLKVMLSGMDIIGQALGGRRSLPKRTYVKPVPPTRPDPKSLNIEREFIQWLKDMDEYQRQCRALDRHQHRIWLKVHRGQRPNSPKTPQAV